MEAGAGESRAAEPAQQGELVPTFTVAAGPNGSGKSTLTRLGRETFQDTVVLDPDAIAKSMQLVEVETGSAIDAGRAVSLRAEELMLARQSFLWRRHSPADVSADDETS